MYSVSVRRIDSLEPIPGCDRIQLANISGYSVIVGIAHKVGDVGILVPEGGVLSHEFCCHNNLYRHSDLNSDKELTGYLEDNRRVRCLKMRGVTSEGLFLDVFCVHFQVKLGQDITKEIGAEKYVPKVRGGGRRSFKVTNSNIQFKKHMDTAQYRLNKGKIRDGDKVIITNKMHGTSGRSALLPVNIANGFWRDLFRLQPRVELKSFLGSRNVELDVDRCQDLYRLKVHLDLIKKLDEGMTVYYEIVGYDEDKPIMGTHSTDSLFDDAYCEAYGETITYDYGLRQGEYDYYVYRITMLGRDGVSRDFTWPQVKNWCVNNEVKHVYEVDRITVDWLTFDDEIAKLTNRPKQLDKDPIGYHITEGIVLRVDNEAFSPLLLKNKCDAFKIMEGIAVDKFGDVEEEN